jgi:hypothetical protein
VVALISPTVRRLADITLRQLPTDAHVVKVETTAAWPTSALDLMAGSMHLVGATARARGIDAARPKVSEFGRRLYHLSASRWRSESRLTAVDRKLAAARIGSNNALAGEAYARALKSWLDELSSVRIRGVVLDYDGTCCATMDRFNPPVPGVQGEIVRLLECGLVIGFASGRGTSLHRALRTWVPKQFWDRVQLGLYNGGVGIPLGGELEDQHGTTDVLSEAAHRLIEGPLGRLLTITKRKRQLSISADQRSGLTHEGLARVVNESLFRHPCLPLKVVVSAHSVDVVPKTSTKASVLYSIQNLTGGAVLAVGDQGQLGGNDFELLAATSRSLSVDLCSADPTRCWNIEASSDRGPAALVSYLRMLECEAREARVVVPQR